MGRFTGFPAEGLRFMEVLARNNNKEWFEANRAQFIETVQTPAVKLVESLGERLQVIDAEIRYDTRTNGSGSLMRFYRDTRFSADKSPYKTNIAMMFSRGTGKKMEAPGFGLQITLEGIDSVAGSFGFSPGALDLYRDAIFDPKLGPALEAAARQVLAAGPYMLDHPQYKRVPKGFDAEHPRAEWLKYTGLAAFGPVLDRSLAQSPELVEVLVGHFEKMAPLYRWLIEALRVG